MKKTKAPASYWPGLCFFLTESLSEMALQVCCASIASERPPKSDPPCATLSAYEASWSV